jgi:RNA polymerase sigma-70 factor (ECF subfamily)
VRVSSKFRRHPNAQLSGPGRRSDVEHPASHDAALIARIAKGDRDAMLVLFTGHQARVFRFILRMTGDKTIAEDLTSEVFLDVWRQAGQFEGRSTVSTWMLAMARYKALAARRRRCEDQLDEEVAEAIEDECDDPEIAVQKKDRSEILRRCLGKLSADHRQIVDLVYYHEKSVDEAAQILAIPENTVKTRLFHARKRLSALANEAGLDRSYL